MQIGIVQQSKIQSFKNQGISANNSSDYVVILGNTDTISFKGQAEIKAANKIVHNFVSLATAFIAGKPGFSPLGDKSVFLAISASMAKKITDVYKLKPEPEVITSTITNLVNKTTKMTGDVSFFDEDLIRWNPILSGCYFPAIAASVTESIGHQFIQLCEKGELK